MKGASNREKAGAMKWDSSDQRGRRIVSYSGWRHIKSYSGLKKKAGVYIFADVDLQVNYIGKAGAGRMVEEITDAIYRDKERGAAQVKALYTDSDEEAQSLEADLIDKYDPPNNRT